MNKIFTHALKIMREMAVDSICSCYASCANHVFNVVGEVSGLVKKDVSILGPLHILWYKTFLPRFTHMTPPLPQPPYRMVHSHLFGPIQLLDFNPLLSLVTWGVISCWKSVLDHHLTPSSILRTWNGDSYILQEEIGASHVRIKFDMKENYALGWIWSS